MKFNGLTEHYLGQSGMATTSSMSHTSGKPLTFNDLNKIVDRCEAIMAGCDVPDGMKMFEHYSPWPAKLLEVSCFGDVLLPTMGRDGWGYYNTRVQMRSYFYKGHGTVDLGWEPNSRTILMSRHTFDPFKIVFRKPSCSHANIS
jgi:hypothetical protein